MERILNRSSTTSLSLQNQNQNQNQLQFILQQPLPISPSHSSSSSSSHSPLPSPHLDHNRFMNSQHSSKLHSRVPSPVPSITTNNRLNRSNSLHLHHHLINRTSAPTTPLGSPNSSSSLGITLPLISNSNPNSKPNTPHYFHPLHYQNHQNETIEELERLRRDHQVEIERLREEFKSLKDERAYLIAKNLRLERELKSINNHLVSNKPTSFHSHHHSIQPLTQIDQPILRRPSFNRSKSNPNVIHRISNLSLSTHQIHHLHQLHRNASSDTTTPSTTAPPSPKLSSKSNEDLNDYITLNSIQRPTYHSRDSSLSMIPINNHSRSTSPNLKSILKKPSVPNLIHHQHGLARLAGIDQIGSHHSISHHQTRKSDGFGS